MRSKAIIKKRTMWTALACAFLSAASLAVTHSAVRPVLTTSPDVTAVRASIAPLVQTQNRLEAERITLRPTGFEPMEITRPAGRFLLAVNDRSGKESVTLLLVRGTGDLLNEVRMRERPRKHEWRQVVNLPPGRYVLREASDPGKTCQITLTGN